MCFVALIHKLSDIILHHRENLGAHQGFDCGQSQHQGTGESSTTNQSFNRCVTQYFLQLFIVLLGHLIIAAGVCCMPYLLFRVF